MRGLLHGAALAVAGAVFAVPLTLPSAVLATAIGAVLGALAAEYAARLRMRRVLALAVALGVGLGGWGTAAQIARWGLGTELLGAHGGLALAETLRWGAGGLAAAMGLRTLSLAWRPLLMLESLIVVVALAVPWAAHRGGMIARPLELSDWFWSHNLDPVWGFVGLGVASTVVVAALWVSGRRAATSAALLLAVFLLALPFGWWLHGAESPSAPEPPGAGGGAGGGEDESDADRRYEDQTRPTPRPREPVAVVVFHRDVQPQGGIFYFRATAFSQFNGVRLVAATRDGVDRGVPAAYAGPSPEGIFAPPVSSLRAAVATDVALMVPQSRPLALIDPVEMQARRNTSPRFRRRYHVVSQVLEERSDELFERSAGNPAWDHDVWTHYTAMPDDPRYLELVTRLAGRLQARYRNDPWAVALAIRTYLEEEATYSFQQQYDEPGTDDPTARFLFSEEKRGYCVHLAHSAALLLRARGIPSRVSAGYAVEAARRNGGSALLLRNVDAHAWAELYLEGVGWVPLEVVPQNVDEEMTPFEEDDLQQLLGEMARDEGRFTPARRPTFDLSAWLGRAARWALWGAVAFVLALRGLRAIRGGWHAWAPSGRTGWAYRSALDGLASYGWVRGRGESREAFARRVAPTSPSFAPLTEQFVRERLTGRSPRGRDPRVHRWTRDARAEAAMSAGWLRRILAWFDPLSWLRAR